MPKHRPSASSSLGPHARSNSKLHKQPPPAHPPRSHSRTASSDASERLSRSQNGSFDATRGSGGTSVVKAAIVKLGASGRRMSLVALSPFDKHINSSPSSEALLERSASPQHGRTVSEASAAYLGVREFVELDEKEHADRLPVETRAGKIASRLELVAGGTGARLTRSSSQRSTDALGRMNGLASPQRIPRKPVPASIPPLEELLTSPRSSSRSHIKQSTLDALQRLQDRGDTGPLAVGESPIKGLEGAEMDRMRAFSAPPASPRYDQSTGLAPLTPLSPSPTLYATPPVTPIPADFVPPPRTPSAPAALSQAPAIPSKSQKRLSVQALGQSARSAPPTLPLPNLPSSTRSPRPHSLIVDSPTSPDALKRLLDVAVYQRDAHQSAQGGEVVGRLGS
ncbi:RHTO0S14e00694g2_1 [Rhodotorula toruloides]|uniref:RHTO0S14e00694g2_1 n=1 Tax=Rhodotorula toruloides TaxID=5286 RepID=A0A061BCZ2_RHOTO|nr:RHTO0S14e00694g2_1 [Rhodotorula toruloides]